MPLFFPVGQHLWLNYTSHNLLYSLVWWSEKGIKSHKCFKFTIPLTYCSFINNLSPSSFSSSMQNYYSITIFFQYLLWFNTVMAIDF